MKRIGTLVRFRNHKNSDREGMLGIVLTYSELEGYRIWWQYGSSSAGWREHNFHQAKLKPNRVWLEVLNESR